MQLKRKKLNKLKQNNQKNNDRLNYDTLKTFISKRLFKININNIKNQAFFDKSYKNSSFFISVFYTFFINFLSYFNLFLCLLNY